MTAFPDACVNLFQILKYSNKCKYNVVWKLQYRMLILKVLQYFIHVIYVKKKKNVQNILYVCGL